MEQHREMESHRCALSQKLKLESKGNLTRAASDRTSAIRIDKQRRQTATPPPTIRAITHQLPVTRVAFPNYSSPSLPHSYTACNNFGQNKSCKFLSSPTVPGPSSPGSRFTIYLSERRLAIMPSFVKDRRNKLASRALGTARVDLATCGPVLARRLRRHRALFARPHF
jgi:hypothetical protein